MKPNVLFVSSKQIHYLRYDEVNHELVVHYATGETAAYPSVSESWYERLLHSENRYDEFMRLTESVMKKPAEKHC
ncbi:KTSC domain-containing protein [Paenibacillus profundus]|uniref:KTSC domain-containing protein n=1 Tax=Paenibacillus profundus TaxID=1173085 RepID=A0ABS8YII2_9BACL|nr:MULTISPECIES: KTSC domain-containing protein [Paenibacillus]MCE5171392.1 KTSC domain-containing protein [Paenibacillus profundus]MCM3338143.1 KTSC domain-containing protein [Paenibacillus sp. MER TA 81-3]